MRYIFLPFFLMFSFVLFGQTWDFAVGANSTNYIFTNSQGLNPPYFHPSTGLNINISNENSLFSYFRTGLGISFSQYNSNGNVQNIPFAYQTDFLGINGSIGPAIELKNNYTIIIKADFLTQKMISGNQFLQNHYVDLSDDILFSKIRYFLGFSLELEKRINQNLFLFTQFQHLDTMQFGSSTLNLVPTGITLGFKIQSK